MSPHVAQVSFLPAPAGLSGAQVLERWPSLADIAEAAASAGTRITVVQAAAHAEGLTRNGVDYLFVDVRGMRRRERGRHVGDLLGTLGVDLAHVHGLGFPEESFALSQRLPRLPVLFQDHADRAPRRWWRRWQWRHRYRELKGVAFTAPELAWPFAAAGVLQPSTRLFAIPESSSRFQRGDRARARIETGLHGHPAVLWVGHLQDGKDPLTALDGIALAAQRLPGLQLWCAYGRAPMMARLRARIERDPWLAGRVHLLGQVPHARIETLMQAADLFVSASRREGSGYSAIEAIACGTVPVLTDIPAFRALAGDARIGRLWPCGDARALADALVAATLEQMPAEQVRAHFDATLSFTAVGGRWREAYLQLLQGRGDAYAQALASRPGSLA
ncbi:glycosyltransferase family 4 protein [Frateuria terrea]|uniref:Glycosyl transferases group 1 n=1 Tax=Frateuria terrea TaxID=529704 RepID=A0A1H6X070_9GAMM|nr:glycosyltransferase family 4 protein [Frateuria terrea]SEJ18122.1 Glycosyl transferases group 1 [Frateuria terrea]SFP56766.1 Glycosyl transferases group 1 [Frateuria terrea]